MLPDKLDDICGGYSFKAMKPMLGYFRQMKMESDNNDKEIQSRDNSIKKLEDELNEFRRKSSTSDGIIKELREQLDLFRKTLLSIGNCESLRAQIDQQNTEITKLKAQIKADDNEIQADKRESELYNITITYEL